MTLNAYVDVYLCVYLSVCLMTACSLPVAAAGGCRVFDFERQKVLAARSELRSKAGGTGDRGHKIRTYNFPQDRITDHRIGLTLPGVHRVLSGEEAGLGTLIDGLQESDASERLQNFIAQARSS